MEYINNVDIINSQTSSSLSNSNLSQMSNSSSSSSPNSELPPSPSVLPVATFAPLRRSHRRAFSLPSISVSTLDLASPSSLDTNTILSPDYVTESAFYQVIDDHFALHQPIGPPPASQNAIKRLPEVKIDENSLNTHKCCSICRDNFTIGAINVVSLPCAHVFDRECVVQWLSQHNTCPMCRFELPTIHNDVEESTGSERSDLAASDSEIEVMEDNQIGSLAPSRSLSLSEPFESSSEDTRSFKRVRASRSSIGHKSALRASSNQTIHSRIGTGSSTSMSTRL